MVRAILLGIKTETRRLTGLSEMNQNPNDWEYVGQHAIDNAAAFIHKNDSEFVKCRLPYGKKGDVLWVRESWKPYSWDCEGNWSISYKAGGNNLDLGGGLFECPDRENEFLETLCDLLEEQACKYDFTKETYVGTEDIIKFKPSIHMPKAAARIWLRVEEVKAERLQDITTESALAEGIEFVKTIPFSGYRNYLVDFKKAAHSPIHSFQTLIQSIHGNEIWKQNPWVWVVKYSVLSTAGRPSDQILVNY